MNCCFCLRLWGIRVARSRHFLIRRTISLSMSAVEELILVVPVSASSLMEALYNGGAGGRAVRLRGGSLVCRWFSETHIRSAVLLAMLYCGSRRCRQGLPSARAVSEGIHTQRSLSRSPQALNFGFN
ncbi:hypothetical protein OCU04_009330 [Sclerotinia nivalis]|uniref:Uncharacterized protein n=1 Tax=Sclerotinia nivalis TaxID=352851 RepID=A0A9X0DFE7_9HELO|nr:hypothetical protein OCU04_009330 [Sclerotinia nivalis]